MKGPTTIFPNRAVFIAIVSFLFLTISTTGNSSATISETLAQLEEATNTLQTLVQHELHYSALNNGVYAGFETMQAEGYIGEDLTPDTIIPGFKLHMLFTNDYTDFILLALPTESREIAGLMVGPDGELKAVAKYDTEYELEEFIQAADALEKSYSSGTGYQYIDIGNFIPAYYGDNRLYISDPKDNYILGRVRGNSDGFLFSETGKTYLYVPFDQENTATSEQVLFLAGLYTADSHAKGTIRSCGSSLLAFQGTNDDKVFGTFSELKEDRYIAEGYTTDSIIRQYKMLWMLSEDKLEFAVAAIPVIDSDILKPYIITSRQTVFQMIPAELSMMDTSWENLINMQNDGWGMLGEYMWIGSDTLNAIDPNLKLCINEEFDAYAILYVSPRIVGIEPENSYAYISSTDTFYFLEPVL
ncbi:MAG TPA: hypothetical protein ENN67_02605 [Firmicutes bacterium]|nr:hypothetical protein [Bacillota bacterium]